MAKQPDSSQSRPASASPETMIEKTSSPITDEPPFVAPAKKKLDTVQPTIRKSKIRGEKVAPLVPEIDSDPADSAELSVTDHLHRNRKPLSSLLVSLIFHTSLIVALALIVRVQPSSGPIINLVTQVVDVPIAEDSEVNIEKIEILAPELNQAPEDLHHEDLSIDTENLAPQVETSLVQKVSEFENPAQADAVAPMALNQTLPTGGGLTGREAEARSRLAGEFGGSKQSEQAVELGLRWIVNHQQSDGSWRLQHDRGECNGRCRNPGTRESTTAATGLALMALLGAGYTHEVGPYQSEVKAGLDYLKSRMRANRYGGNLAEGSMYAQGIATIALSEAYILTRDVELKETVELAMNYIVAAQHRAGGWRYNPGEPGDMTVTGWQLMALKSCALGGFEVPRETWDKARKFLDSKAESGGSYYGYIAPGIEPVPTAVGLLSQMYLGWSRDNGSLNSGAERLADWGPSENDVYFNYYGTQVLHHLRTPAWDEWNPQLRDYLVNTQDKRGHQAGSWYFEERHGKSGGRLYTTAMAVMILEVYYRYLPLYEDRAVD